MAEERTLGLARATEPAVEELSKEELQRRMDEARDSISHTVTEIKDTVANQVQAVKDTLDWREQFKKRPLEWSAGALGLGFIAGYGIAAAVKGSGNGRNRNYEFASGTHSYAAQPVLGQTAASMRPQYTPQVPETAEDSGPGLVGRLKTTPAYERVSGEVANIGNSILDELSKTAKQVLVPAVVKSIKDFIGGYLPRGTTSQTAEPAPRRSNPIRDSANDSSYHPVLERNPT